MNPLGTVWEVHPHSFSIEHKSTGKALWDFHDAEKREGSCV